jgi:hypothetical protein
VRQVGRENPSELKAAKLARSMARGVEDRDLKPNTRERAQIEAVILAPPNRCGSSHAIGWVHARPAELAYLGLHRAVALPHVQASCDLAF